MSNAAANLPGQTNPPAVGDSTPPCWQSGFLRLLPAIQRDVQIAFRRLPGEAREEAVQEALCSACLAYARLARQGRPQAATASSLARYAVAQYWAGRRVGASLNRRDATSAYCHRQMGVQVQSLSFQDQPRGEWRELLVEDHRVTPADLAASRIDYPAFLASLGTFRRRIAETLATGETTQRVARLFGLSEGRISQLRREFKDAWEAFSCAETRRCGGGVKALGQENPSDRRSGPAAGGERCKKRSDGKSRAPVPGGAGLAGPDDHRVSLPGGLAVGPFAGGLGSVRPVQAGGSRGVRRGTTRVGWVTVPCWQLREMRGCWQGTGERASTPRR